MEEYGIKNKILDADRVENKNNFSYTEYNLLKTGSFITENCISFL